jgi:hypothetical protein
VKLPVQLHRGPGRRPGLARVVTAVGLVAALGAPFALPADRASADQVDQARQQVAAAEAQVVAGARRVHQLTVEYDQASLEASALSGLVATGEAQVARLQVQAVQASSRLRQEAIDSYTGAYRGVPSLIAAPPGSAVDDPAVDDPAVDDPAVDDPAVRAAYVSLASGDLRDSLDSYQASRRRLAQAQAVLAASQQRSLAAASALQHARDAAVAEANTDQARLDSLNAQLTSLEAAQTAADAQAAASARAARASAPAGPPVNGGLLAVVQAAVDQPPAQPVQAPANVAPPVSPPTPSPVVAVAPTAVPASTSPTSTSGDGGAGGVWLQLRECESGDNYQADTGNGYYGAYQFSQQTWSNLGFPGRPDLEPPSMQDQAAMKLQSESGWGQWPACSAALGLS